MVKVPEFHDPVAHKGNAILVYRGGLRLIGFLLPPIPTVKADAQTHMGHQQGIVLQYFRPTSIRNITTPTPENMYPLLLLLKELFELWHHCSGWNGKIGMGSEVRRRAKKLRKAQKTFVSSVYKNGHKASVAWLSLRNLGSDVAILASKYVEAMRQSMACGYISFESPLRNVPPLSSKLSTPSWQKKLFIFLELVDTIIAGLCCLVGVGSGESGSSNARRLNYLEISLICNMERRHEGGKVRWLRYGVSLDEEIDYSAFCQQICAAKNRAR